MVRGAKSGTMLSRLCYDEYGQTVTSLTVTGHGLQ